MCSRFIFRCNCDVDVEFSDIGCFVLGTKNGMAGGCFCNVDTFDRSMDTDMTAGCIRSVGTRQIDLRFDMEHARYFTVCLIGGVCEQCDCYFLSCRTHYVKRDSVCAVHSACCRAEMDYVVASVHVNCCWPTKRPFAVMRGLFVVRGDCGCRRAVRDRFVGCFVVFMDCVGTSRTFDFGAERCQGIRTFWPCLGSNSCPWTVRCQCPLLGRRGRGSQRAKREDSHQGEPEGLEITNHSLFLSDWFRRRAHAGLGAGSRLGNRRSITLRGLIDQEIRR